MNRERRNSLFCAIVCVVTAFCSGCEWKAEGQSYNAARTAMLADANFPKNATIADKDECKFYIAKSGGCVVVPFYYVDGSGTKQTDSYTVWVDRIAWDWKVDRLARTPKY